MLLQQIQSVFISTLDFNFFFSMVIPTEIGTLDHGSISATLRNMDGDREMSIGIFVLCSSLLHGQALVGEALKTFRTARNGGSRDLKAGNYFLSRFGDPTKKLRGGREF